jgi:paxillin
MGQMGQMGMGPMGMMGQMGMMGGMGGMGPMGGMGMSPMISHTTPQTEPSKPVEQPTNVTTKVESDLDDILAGLDEPTTKPSDSTKKNIPLPIENLPRGCCAGCRKFIIGEVTTAMGRSYHPEHFVCSSCGDIIGTASYFEKDRLPQCTKCYQQHYCSKCARCDKPITSQLTTALSKKWHTACFTCKGCLAKLGQQFYEHANQPYCITCYKGVQSVVCKSCGNAISGQNINALNAYWHPEHFCCQTCNVTFPTGQFYQYNGFPFCPTHYMQLQQQMMGGGMMGM